jgi:hypothetical protein
MCNFCYARFLGGLEEEIRYIIVLHRPKEMDTASASALSFIFKNKRISRSIIGKAKPPYKKNDTKKYLTRIQLTIS